MAILVSDSFNRSDSTTSLGTAETGQTWNYAIGTWGISGNKAYPFNAPDNSHCYAESGISNGNVSVTFSTVAMRSRLMFRWSDSSNYLTAVAYGTEYRIYTIIGGIFTSIASSTGITPANGDIVKVELNGSTVKLYVNGTLAITTTSTHNQNATKHGLNIGSTAGTTRFDDFKVEDFNASGTDGSTKFDSNQVIYSDSNVKADSKQQLYLDSLSSFDSKQSFYSDGTFSGDTKQSLYTDSSFMFDLLVRLYHDSTVQADVKQTLYSDSTSAYETRVNLYQDGTLLFDTSQEFFSDGIVGSTPFDLRLVLYADASVKGDLTQLLYTDGTIDFDTFQGLLEDWTEYNEVIRIMLNITRKQTSDISITRKQALTLDITQRKQSELNL